MVRLAGIGVGIFKILLLVAPLAGIYALMQLPWDDLIYEHPWLLIPIIGALLLFRMIAPVINRIRKLDV